MRVDKNKIMLSGGGTGGSVTPLLAFSSYYQRLHPEAEFVFVGHANPEKRLVEAGGMKFVSITAGKWRRYFSLANFFDGLKILRAFFQSCSVIRRERPSILMTAGSFVSVPLSWAARLHGVPILVHQQDVRPGLANRLMAPFARKVTVVFEKSLKDYGGKAVITGNPANRFDVDGKKIFSRFNLDASRPLLLAFGGGTGAEVINKAVAGMLPDILHHCQIILVTGPGKPAIADLGLLAQYESLGYREVEFLDYGRLLEAMAASKLVISRAGLGALTDLSSLSKSAIIIPISGSHQEDNAAVFAEAGAVIRVDQAEANGSLAHTVESLLSDEKQLASLSEKISAFSASDACAKMAAVVDAEKIKG